MGTGYTGRYLSTKGSAKKASQYSVIHSSEGTFMVSEDKHHHHYMRLKSGGHGQKNIELLEHFRIEYHIVKTYSNGVRVGYIPNHKSKIKQTGINQSWFPKNWTDKDIKKAGEHVASLKANRNAPSGKTLYGRYKGVDVCVKKTNGIIGSIFPNSIQKTKRRK